MKKVCLRGGVLSVAASFLFLTSTPAMSAYVGGRVLDSTGVKAMQGAEIRIVELDRTTQTEEDGYFRFGDVPAGTYTFEITYTGAETITRTEEVSEPGTLLMNFALAPSIAVADTILVIGQQANLASALTRQRNAGITKTVLTRDAIGQFPDQNVSEALRRAPGVTVLNDQGEGRFVSIRGLSPNLNSASINGARVPAPESDVRSVALDVIAVELLESIEIHKTLTPDMDADTLGGSLELNTTSAFDRDKPFYSITLEGSYNELRDEISPKGAIDFSTRVSERFGVAGGFSYYRRKFSTDNIEPDGWSETDDGIVYADEVQYRDYDVRRTRLSGSLSFDFKATDNTTLFARTLYSEFNDLEFRHITEFGMDEEPSFGDATSATFLSDDGEIAVVRNNKNRTEKQTIASVVIGGETFADAWTFNYEASYSYAREKENGSLDTMDFERVFEEEGELMLTFDYSDYKLPLYMVDDEATFFDPSEYEFDELERTTLSDAEDEEWSFRFDIAREFGLDQGSIEVKAGGKARLRDKMYNADIDFFGFDGDFTVADVLGEQSYGLLDISPVIDPIAMQAFYEANIDSFEFEEIDSIFDSAVEDYTASEDIYAGYLMATYETSTVRIIGGVRMEHTRNTLRGNQVELLEEGAIFEGEELEDDIVLISPTEFKRDYTDWLPSLNVRFEAGEDVILRGGIFRSLVRPNFEELRPAFQVEENDEGDREGTFGDPNLQPLEAWNFDAGVEYYFDDNAVVQLGAFYKDIKNFIVFAEFEEIEFNGIFATEAVIPINGDDAEVFGIEFSFQQAFTFLPSPFDGLLLGLNYTYTDATGTVDGRKVPLPATSEHTFNATIGYDKGPFSLRIAGTYSSKYLDELGGDPEEDRYVKGRFLLDISVKYRVTENIQLFADFINLNNAPWVHYQEGPGSRRLRQFERYSWTGKFGAKATF